MKTILTTILFVMSGPLLAQNYNGFVITESDSLFKGYMRILSGGAKGTKFLITKDKKKKPKEFFSSELKYYAYKKDTFIFLRDFYPFENADYVFERLEAKVLISRGQLKLYSSSFFPSKKDPNRAIVTSPGMGPQGYGSGVSSIQTKAEPIYIIKNRDGYFIRVRKNKEDFIRAMESAIGDNTDLIKKVKLRKLSFTDMKKIIVLYNQSKNEVSQ
jgi:hypothetical protein